MVAEDRPISARAVCCVTARYFAFVLFSGATLLTSLKPSPVAVFLFWCDKPRASLPIC